MIGVFDSGVGGLCAFREIRRLMPRENILYLADRKNSPYGTKTKEEIITLTKADIKRLCSMGARKILIACCTASSIHGELDPEEKEISVPIISPAAKAVKGINRVAVIATEHTARGRFFSREIERLSDSRVFEFPKQRLVALIEGGCRDGQITKECRAELLKIKNELKEIKAEALILGCTHFSHLEGELRGILPGVKIISPAREGARELVRLVKTDCREGGRNIYT